jgi:hypothetical protein
MSTRPSRAPDPAVLAWLVPVPAERDMPAGRQQAIREHLIGEFRESSAPAVTGSARTARERRTRAMGRPLTAVIAGMAVTAAVTGIVIAATSTTAGLSPLHRASCLLPANSYDPFPGGHQTTIPGARSAVRFPILVPHNALANRRTLSQVWVSRADQLVALMYDHRKITILMTPWPVAQSPGKWFRYERSIMIKKYVAVGRVNGGPALIVLKPNIDYCHANPALIEFYWRGIDISVRSRNHGAAALLRIADSIR